MTFEMLNEVKINAVDVSSYVIGWKVVRTFGQEISNCEINLSKSVEGVVTLTPAQSITVKRGTVTATDQFLFSGEIVKIEETGYSFKVTGNDELYDAIKSEVTKSFDYNDDPEGGVISELFKTLVNSYTNLTCDNTTVVATSSVPTEIRKKFICRHEDVFDKLKELADLANYQFYYNPVDDKVYFEPKGFTEYVTPLVVGGGYVTNRPKWVTDNTELCNYITIIGATQNVETTVNGTLGSGGFGSGDGGVGPLGFKPVSVKVYADASTPPVTLRVGGVPGATSSYDYYVDFEKKECIWETSGGYAWTAGHKVMIFVTHAIPVPVVAYDQDSIDLYTRFSRTINLKQVMNVNDAELIARRYLDDFGVPFRSTKLKVVGLYDINSGDKVRVVDTVNGVDDVLVVNQVTFSFPFNGDEIEVGDRELKVGDFESSVARKLKEHDEALSGDSDYLLFIYTFRNDIALRPRYLSVEKKDIGDRFTLDHPVNSLTTEAGGTAILDGTYGASEVIYMSPGENTFKEFVYDTEFYDSINSTGVTWDTSGQDITIEDGALYTDFVAKGTTYGYVTLYLGDTTTISNPSLNTGLLHFYNCNEASGTSLADGVSDRDGTLTNGAAFTGNAIEFDGTNDYVNFSDAMDGTVKSISVWAYNDIDITASSTTMAFLGGFAAPTIYAGPCSGVINNEIITLSGPSVIRAGWSAAALGTATIPIGLHHYVFVFESASVKWRLYLDGSDKGLNNLQNDTPVAFASWNPVFGTDSAGTWWNGQLMMLGVWSTELTAVDAGLLYNAGAGLTVPFVTTYTVEVSADNKVNWQTLTEGVRTALTSSDDSGVYLRITADGTLLIETTFNVDGTLSDAAIELRLEE